LFHFKLLLIIMRDGLKRLPARRTTIEACWEIIGKFAARFHEPRLHRPFHFGRRRLVGQSFCPSPLISTPLFGLQGHGDASIDRWPELCHKQDGEPVKAYNPPFSHRETLLNPTMFPSAAGEFRAGLLVLAPLYCQYAFFLETASGAPPLAIYWLKKRPPGTSRA
jgi:hypothetical protein